MANRVRKTGAASYYARGQVSCRRQRRNHKGIELDRWLPYNRALDFTCQHDKPEFFMSHHADHHNDHHHDHHADTHRDPDPADSKADAIAAFFAIAIAVSGVLFFVSQH